MNEINISCNHLKYPINKENLKLFCKKILNYRGYTLYLVSIIFVSQEKLKKMKKKYFKKDMYTDVIAFNLNEKNEDLEGELYISYNYVKHNAKCYKTNFEEEIRRVIAHGLLHLIGYEDSTIKLKKEMTKFEDFFINFLEDKKLLC